MQEQAPNSLTDINTTIDDVEKPALSGERSKHRLNLTKSAFHNLSESQSNAIANLVVGSGSDDGVDTQSIGIEEIARAARKLEKKKVQVRKLWYALAYSAFALILLAATNFGVSILAIKHMQTVYVQDNAVLTNEEGQTVGTKAIGGGGMATDIEISFWNIGRRMLTGAHNCPPGLYWVSEKATSEIFEMYQASTSNTDITIVVTRDVTEYRIPMDYHSMSVEPPLHHGPNKARTYYGLKLPDPTTPGLLGTFNAYCPKPTDNIPNPLCDICAAGLEENGQPLPVSDIIHKVGQGIHFSHQRKLGRTHKENVERTRARMEASIKGMNDHN